MAFLARCDRRTTMLKQGNLNDYKPFLPHHKSTIMSQTSLTRTVRYQAHILPVQPPLLRSPSHGAHNPQRVQSAPLPRLCKRIICLRRRRVPPNGTERHRTVLRFSLYKRKSRALVRPARTGKQRRERPQQYPLRHRPVHYHGRDRLRFEGGAGSRQLPS